MSQCCGKIPTPDDVQHIRDSILEYQEIRADEEAIREYIQEQTQDAKNSGTPSSGQTKVQQDGSVQKISPYNPGDVIQVETYEKDGSIHYTTVNTATNVRHSYTVNSSGRVVRDHSTNQNVSKGSKNRHK
ncbi:MAG: hypothetical protein ACD_61C00305G0002 [uncultured bacterium]|uniref:Uncharacterized protein n=2 Tax=Microgenomates group TaxID=1794810 RepID=A0A0G1LF43_9BACT|nr:MAG: hypothetical protein ACD_61C00305G0002 [uncultured bacterium]KKT29633.1 MAG: hypothetical protein UW16_C0026G0010 [Microgenomates group bacterium GW2011_GWC1_44_10]KKT49677.1 MAG: hypothetical protein UW41_C0003G0044 [Candidatus Collierbacteria bacterium GW2011_GWC2_44_18]KKT67302.1 MAG: hypothetical protein UW60_C0009G0008 [Candidatus Woesebacteria bacterium GW2011_GWA2_44_33]